MSWFEYLSSGWTLVVVPTAIAIAALAGFIKTLLEKRNLELQNQKLHVEVAAATSRIVLATDEQVEKYAFRRHFMSRTIRIASVLLAVGLPTTLVLNTQLGQGPEAGPVPAVRPAPVPEPDQPSPPVLPRSLPIGRWNGRGPGIVFGRAVTGKIPSIRRVTEIEFLPDGRLTGRAGGTTFVGTWGAETGKLIARSDSGAEPAFRFECDLVYVEYQQSPRSSYVLGECTNSQDRWKWELTTASPVSP